MATCNSSISHYLSLGFVAILPSIPYSALRNLQDMDAIVDWIKTMPDKCSTCSEFGNNGDAASKKMHAVVAGAGFIGLEMVEQLMRRGLDVTVVEMLPQVLGPIDVEMAAIVEEDMIARGVTLVTGDAIQEFAPNNNNGDENDPSTIVKLKSGKMLPPAQITILGLGVRPDTKIVREAGITCTARGHIQVDDYLRTNVDNVWAAGDSIEVRNPIIGADEKWAVPLAGVSLIFCAND